MTLDDYKELTKGFEGLRLKPYKCSANKLSIGYGRNLEDCGISKEEADVLFNNDFKRATEDTLKLLKERHIDSSKLSVGRLYVVIDMCFNMGYNRLNKFNKFFTALAEENYEEAAKEMKNSAWYTQVGKRAVRLCSIMQKSS